MSDDVAIAVGICTVFCMALFAIQTEGELDRAKGNLKSHQLLWFWVWLVICLMSGPLAVVREWLTIFQPNVGSQAGVFRASLLTSFVLSGFAAIITLYRRISRLETGYLLPDICGSITGVQVDINQHPHEDYDEMAGDVYCTFGVVFWVQIFNNNPINTNIIQVELDSTAITVPIGFACVNGLVGTELKRGFSGNAALYARVTLAGSRLCDVKNIDIRGVKVIITDGFNHRHVLPSRYKEMLTYHCND